jgi:hypothetical protein
MIGIVSPHGSEIGSLPAGVAVGPAAWEDISRDGGRESDVMLDFGDINPFVELLATGQGPCP